jgi:hypothetical protein
MKEETLDNRSKEKNGLTMGPTVSLTIIQISNKSGGFVTMSQTNSTSNEGQIISGVFAAPNENTGEDFNVVLPTTEAAPLLIGTCGGIYKTFINSNNHVIIKQFKCDGGTSKVYNSDVSEFPKRRAELRVTSGGKPSYTAED